MDRTEPGGTYPQRFGIPEGLYAESVAVKQGWMCCWNGGDSGYVSTGVIGSDRRYVVAIGSMQTANGRHRAQHHHPGREDDAPCGRPDLVKQVGAAVAGALQPDSAARRRPGRDDPTSTSGTSSPRQLGGLV